MNYKDLEAWKKSIELVKEVYKITMRFPNEEQFGLTFQIKRAVISIPSNIAEGCARFSNKDSARFIDISIGSVAEVETQLIIAQELDYVDNIELELEHLKQLSGLLVGLKRYLSANQNSD